MIVCKKYPQWDPNTGEETEALWVKTAEHCDYLGNEVDPYEVGPQIILDYRNSDPCFGSISEEFEFGMKTGINLGFFLKQPYIYSAEGMRLLVLEAVAEVRDLPSMMRLARIRAAQTMLMGDLCAEALDGFPRVLTC